MRPELTIGRARAQMLRRWWLFPLCMAAVAAAALALSGRNITNAKATARVHVQDVSVSYQFQGQPQPSTQTRTAGDLTSSDFIDPQVAAAAARALADGTTGQQLIAGLGFAALTGTDVQLSYSDGSSQQEVTRRLGAYVKALVKQRIAAERQALEKAAATLSANGGPAGAVARLQSAADGLGQQIHQTGATTATKPRTLPAAALLAAGLLAGAILAALVALAIGQADPRIRSLADLRAAGVRAIAADHSRPESLQALRALIEVGGVDANGGVVAVVTPHGDHGDALSHTLAESFALSGRPATWLSERGIARHSDGAWSQPVSGTGVLGSLPRLREALSGVEAGDVVVIDAAALLDHPQSLVATAVAAVTVVVLRRGRSTWSDLEMLLELLEDAVIGGRVRVCLDRGGRRQGSPPLLSQPAAEQAPA
jgi:hypothetical protein